MDPELDLELELNLDLDLEPESDLDLEPEPDLDLEPELDLEPKLEPEPDLELDLTRPNVTLTLIPTLNILVPHQGCQVWRMQKCGGCEMAGVCMIVKV